MHQRLARGFVVVSMAMLVGALLVIPAGESAPAKKAKSCTILKPAAIQKVVGSPVSGPGKAGTLDIGCDFEIGPGLGEPGGGSVIIQYYTGTLAKNVWSSAKATGEKVGKAAWNAETGIASGYRKGRMVAASISYTGGDPPASSLKNQTVELVNLALEKL